MCASGYSKGQGRISLGERLAFQDTLGACLVDRISNKNSPFFGVSKIMQ